jgi:hypothetical protein
MVGVTLISLKLSSDVVLSACLIKKYAKFLVVSESFLKMFEFFQRCLKYIARYRSHLTTVKIGKEFINLGHKKVDF